MKGRPEINVVEGKKNESSQTKSSRRCVRLYRGGGDDDELLGDGL